MHIKSHLVVGLILIVTTAKNLHGQGCSDAGICTLNGLKPESVDSTETINKNVVRIGASYGRADHQIQVIGNYIDYTRIIRNNWEANWRLTALGQSGNGISVYNISDIYFTALYSVKNAWKLTGGIKVPLKDGNISFMGRSLPMDYQSSLGTLDALAGVNYQYSKWKFQLGIQLPLVQNNNTFSPFQYPDSDSLSRFVATNNFKRRGDAILRASRTFPIGKHFKVTPGLLGIYHFREDAYTDTMGRTLPIIGSDGTTVNGTLFVDYSFSKKQALQLSLGTPFIVRDVRPDGLTRSIVVNLEYNIQF